MRWSRRICPCFYLTYCISWSAYVEPFLYLWDESYLVMMYNLFDHWLHCACQCLAEDFCIHIHWKNKTGLYFSFSVGFLSGSEIRVIVASRYIIRSPPSLSISLTYLKSIFGTFMKLLQYSPVKLSGSGIFLGGRGFFAGCFLFSFLFFTASISLPVMGLLRVF